MGLSGRCLRLTASMLGCLGLALMLVGDWALEWPAWAPGASWASACKRSKSVWGAHASPPADLSNFQNEYVCDPGTRIVRPRNVKDVQDAVRLHSRIQAIGVGHSWNRPFFCSTPNVTTLQPPSLGLQANTTSEPDGAAANIVMSTVRPLSIQVLEDEEAVLVDAGVITIDLLNYLANYVTEKAPAGWTLPAFAWYVYQTIGGAVATGTHGSSLTWSTMSSQVLAFELVAANGSLVTLTPKTHPFLMKAARISVGKLGIITRLKMRIVREQPVTRTLRFLPVPALLSLLREGQEQYKANGTLPDALNETEFFWQTQKAQFMVVSFTRGDVADPATRHAVLSQYVPGNTTVYNTSTALLQDPSLTRVEDLPLLANTTFGGALGLAPGSQAYTQSLLANTINKPIIINGTLLNQKVPNITASDGRAADGGNGTRLMATLSQPFTADTAVAWGSSWTPPDPKKPSVLYSSPMGVAGLLEVSEAGVSFLAANATLEATAAYLKEPEVYEATINNVLFDQYEVAFPVSSMADCVEEVLTHVYGPDLGNISNAIVAQDHGFRTAPLFRFVGKEDALLSLTGSEPRLFLNIEDYVHYNGLTRVSNSKFKAIMAILRSSPKCGSEGLNGTGGRLHWGKAGWPDAGCWRGDVEYPGGRWCDFGCAVAQMDPTGKFQDSAQDRWTWAGVDLARCCTPDVGFNHGDPTCVCQVQHSRPIEDCPPPPYYTYR